MKRLDFGFVIIIVLFIATGGIAWNSYFKIYRQKDTVNIHDFPKTIGEWTSEEMKITEEEYAILETRNAFSRQYTNPEGKEAYLLLVYSQNNRKVSHPPEICFTGGGLTILNKSRNSFESEVMEKPIEANRLLMEHGKLRHIAYYWFKVGDVFTASYLKQQFLIALKTLTGQPASSALVRLTVAVDGDEKTADQNIKEFSTLITPNLMKYLP